jgi:putative endonuclease
MKQYYVYIITNKRNGTIYVGSTSDLEVRMWDHKNKTILGSFSSRYSLNKLMYYEEQPDAKTMVGRERTIKHWPRKYKLGLIEENNPEWNDLSSGWFDD